MGRVQWNYEGKRPGEMLTNEEIYELLQTPGAKASLGSFPRQYNEAIPKHFKDIDGLEGEHFDDAYTGRYSAQSTDWGG